MKHNVYLFSGLGADERVFTRIKLPKSQVRHIKWPKVTKDTSREQFLNQIRAQIQTKSNNVLLGVSFGGLVAQDIAAIIPTAILIIVSSVENEAEMPQIYRSIFARLALKLTPGSLLIKPNFLMNYMFSIQTSEGRNTLRDIIRDSDPAFVRWAITYVQQWHRPNLSSVKRLCRIHGANDRIFPYISKGVETNIVHGGHFAVYEAAGEINHCLKSWL